MKILKTVLQLLLLASLATPMVAKPKIGEYFDDPKVKALYRAVGKSPKAAAKLIEQGADVNARGKENMTLLLFSVLNVEKKKYHHLLELGADPNVIWESSWRTFDNVMQMVSRDSDSSWLEAALQHGGDPNLKAKDGSTPLDEALGATEKNNIRILVKYGADPGLPAEMNTTPLVRALGRYMMDISRIFLESGAEWRDENGAVQKRIVLNLRDFSGNGPRAVENNRKKIELIDWLIADGAVFDEEFMQIVETQRKKLGMTPETATE